MKRTHKDTASGLLVLSVFIFILENCDGRKNVDIAKEVQDHAYCNEERIDVPTDWILTGITASASCAGISNRYCWALCLAHHYPGVMKNNRINKKHIKKMADQLDISKQNQFAKEEMMKALDDCEKDLPDLPPPKNNKCNVKAVRKFKECLEARYRKVCNPGGTPKDDEESFSAIHETLSLGGILN